MTPRRRNSEWDQLRKNAVAYAEALTRQTNRDLPINLLAIAKQQRIRRVEFRQLLVEGGLSVLSNGFNVYVNCDPGQGEQLTEEFANDGTGSCFLPKVRSRLRFTIAHEIAHTLLYDIRAGAPRPRYLLKRFASIRRIENLCNILAGALLLPDWIIRRELECTDLTDVSQLRTLANRALISPETLVRRFRKLRDTDHPECIIAAVERKGNDLNLLAVSRHYRFTELFAKARPHVGLQALVYDPDFVPFGGDFASVIVPVQYAAGPTRTYQFNCETRDKYLATSFLVTAHPISS
jgi:hypothetical protein